MMNVVVLYEYNLLNNYDDKLTKVASSLYKHSDYWKDRRTLYDAVKNYAVITGFSVYVDVEYIRCNRYGFLKKRKKKNDPSTVQETRNMEKLKIGCTFSIKIVSSQKIKCKSKNTNSKIPYKWRNDFSDNIPVTISVANCMHCDQCKPSTQQQLMTRSRSRKYVQGISKNDLFTLFNML